MTFSSVNGSGGGNAGNFVDGCGGIGDGGGGDSWISDEIGGGDAGVEKTSGPLGGGGGPAEIIGPMLERSALSAGNGHAHAATPGSIRAQWRKCQPFLTWK